MKSLRNAANDNFVKMLGVGLWLAEHGVASKNSPGYVAFLRRLACEVRPGGGPDPERELFLALADTRGRALSPSEIVPRARNKLVAPEKKEQRRMEVRRKHDPETDRMFNREFPDEGCRRGGKPLPSVQRIDERRALLLLAWEHVETTAPEKQREAARKFRECQGDISGWPQSQRRTLEKFMQKLGAKIRDDLSRL